MNKTSSQIRKIATDPLADDLALEIQALRIGSFQIFDMEFIPTFPTHGHGPCEMVPFVASVIDSETRVAKLYVRFFKALKQPSSFIKKRFAECNLVGDAHGIFIHKEQMLYFDKYVDFLTSHGKEFEVVAHDKFVPMMRELVRAKPTYGSGPSQDIKLLGLQEDEIHDLQAQTQFLFTKADLMNQRSGGVAHFPDDEVTAFLDIMTKRIPNSVGISFLDFARSNPSENCGNPIPTDLIVRYARATLEAGIMTLEYARKVLLRTNPNANLALLESKTADLLTR